MNLDNSKVLLLNSGGADSVASALLLRRAGYEVYSMFINYGQPSALIERDSAHLMMMNYNFMGIKESDKFVEAKLELETSFDDKTSEEIYLRNFVFMSYASQYAYSHGIGIIAVGYVGMNTAIRYADDNPVFLQDFHSLLSHFGQQLLLPIAGYDKDMVYTTLLDYGIDPIELPYCNFVDPKFHNPCGICEKCEITKRDLTALKTLRKERGIEDGVLSKSLDPIFAENS
jgi:7-cyano-7-deazaguanine synthase in queuosine biosynthesis